MPPNLLSCNLTSLLFLLPLNLVLPLRRPLLICLPFCQTPYFCLASLSPSSFIVHLLVCLPPSCPCLLLFNLTCLFVFLPPFCPPHRLQPRLSSSSSPLPPPPSPIQPCLASFSPPSSPICLPVASP